MTHSVQPALLETRDLRISFLRRGQEKTVVDGTTFRLAAGKTLAIVGESGAGKTLSCRALLGLLPPDAIVSGSARFEGNEILTLRERDLRRYRGKCIAMVFQDPAQSLNPTMQVGHQIAEAIRAHENVLWPAARKSATERLARLRFDTPAWTYERYPHQLSGGMQQRIMLAIALAGKPKLLIADEATRSLDATTQAEIMALLMELKAELGMAIIMISHDLRLAATIADDVLVMQAGRCVEYGPANTLFHSARKPYTQALIGAAMPPAGSRTGPATGVRARLVGDLEAETVRPSAEPVQPQAALLSVRDVVQTYRPRGLHSDSQHVVRAVSGVSFDWYPGEVLGLVGETGSGKSTLARTVLLEPRPRSGSVLLNGVELTRLGRRDLAKQRRHMQIVFQDPYGSLNPAWSVATIVEEPLVSMGMTRAEREQRVRKVLDLVDLPCANYGRRRPRALSGGQCQRIAIARALAPNPRLIILDEALSSLDALIQRQMLDLLQRLRAELGIAFLVISHDLALVGTICDRIAVMRDGQLCEIGLAETLYRSPSHPYTASLLASVPKAGQRNWPRITERGVPAVELTN
jgi:peptide/nickel transport system ATP-binding protein